MPRRGTLGAPIVNPGEAGMRAVVVEEHGGPEVLVLREVPDPEPGPDEVLVDVVATALNRADLLQRMGLYPGPPMTHEIPGMEFAGRVVGRGGRVTGLDDGAPIMGIVGGGSYAERLVTHCRQVLAVPPTVPLADAAAIPEVFITAWDALVRQGGLTTGLTALVHAGASGVGTAAIQIAHAVGARIAVTASAGKVAACRELGADLVVDYGAEDYVEAVLDWSDGAGVDVVLDVVGGDYADRNLAVARPQGRIIQVGVMGSGRAEIDLGLILRKRLTLRGTVLRSRPIEEKIAVTQQVGRELLPRFDDGTLAPVIDSCYPITEVVEAHRHMEANANIGKILLDLPGSDR
jgi:putative PIG3 family NAD(P)H quinone oxidoreductase